MKLFATTALSVMLATTAFATTTDEPTETSDAVTVQVIAFSSRSAQHSDGASYPYINPYGVGPSNDSR